MSIEYIIKGFKVNRTSCYGSINSYAKRGTEEFDGITLILEDFIEQGDDYMRSMASMAHAVGFGEYIPRTIDKLKKDRGFHFDKGVPFYVVVAVTGFFRAWDNHKNLLPLYEMLMKKGLDPYEALVVAYSLGIRSGTSNDYIFSMHGEHSIIPWSISHKGGLAAFRLWNSRVGELPSMEEEYRETNGLSYAGRDEWFGAHNSGNETYFDGDEWEEYKGTSEALNHLKSGEYNEYHPNPVDIDSLVEAVKSWRK